ncbi:MAG TPA: exonuclease domain-containing protein [Streptosporangiaceae bacterium]|nr:exonuclease domain-containing protein [Streptosporangiaceae bacterium]
MAGRWAAHPLRALTRRQQRRLDSPDGPGVPFHRLDFVIVDVETTGLSPGEASITEIGAVRVRRGRVRDRFTSLVNPGGAIPEQVAAVTGISDAMVASAPSLALVLRRFLDFAGRDCVLTAHNAAFDVGFLTAACDACHFAWPAFPVLDTLDLAHQLLAPDEVPNCKLATLADFFGARTLPCHRALPDALATADVLAALLRRLAAIGVTTLSYGEAGPGLATLGVISEATEALGDTLPATDAWQGGTSGHRDRADPC